MIINGRKVVNDDVLVARRLEGRGFAVPALELLRLRIAQLRRDIYVEAQLWGDEIDPRDVALTRAHRLAMERERTP